MQGPPGSSLHGGVDHGLAGLEGVLRPPGGKDEPERDIVHCMKRTKVTTGKFEAARNFWLKSDLESVEGYFQESGNL